MKKNWINEVLEETAKEVRDWPDWMLRPEARVATSGTETPAKEPQNENADEAAEAQAPPAQDQ